MCSVLADAGTQIRLTATVVSRTYLTTVNRLALSHDSVIVGQKATIILSTLPNPRVNIKDVQEANKGTKRQSLPVLSDHAVR